MLLALRSPRTGFMEITRDKSFRILQNFPGLHPLLPNERPQSDQRTLDIARVSIEIELF
jgi:hypothetical protein